jgi:RHS repeat-associated protein
VPLNGTSYTSNITTTTTYLSGFVFESKAYSNASLASLQYTDKLQYTPHEEGRMRLLYDNTAAPTTITGTAYDYFIKDHLGNVRMVITDEIKTIIYPAATLEGTYDVSTNSMVNYEKQFYTINQANITNETSITSWGTESLANTKLYYNHNGNPPTNINYPAGASPVQTAGSTKLYKLNAASNKTGLEFIIKVMAGDKIDIFGKSYYLNTTNVTNTNSTPLDLLTLMSTFLLAPGNVAAGKGFTSTTLNTANTGLVPGTFFRGSNSESTTTVPKAYINYIFFDEQFKYAGGNFSRVGTSGSVKDHWQTEAQLQNINVPKNGYLFVYVSNESNFDVFFDNIQVIHKPGPLLEETHYYPFGLTMAGISSKAAGKLTNKYKFGGKELSSNDFSDGSGMETYDFGARNYDPQVGRWWSNDPVADKLHGISPYNYALNNPIKFVDPDGKYPIVIHVRSFAPFATFGGGNWIGDNRGFSTDLNKTSRLSQATSYETTTQQYTSQAKGSISMALVDPLLPTTGSLVAQSEARVQGGDDGNGNGKGDRFQTHLSGNDDAVIAGIDGTMLENMQSPDIDVHSSFSIVAGGKDGKGNELLSITGSLSGDGFPAAEAFVSDAKGNKAFLGAGGAQYGPNVGPLLKLFGDGDKHMANLQITLAVNKDGVFQGVYQNTVVDSKLTTTYMSLADWNKQFEKKDPTKK